MLSKSKIKQLQSLKLKKYRQKYNLFLAEGDKIAETLLLHKRRIIEEVIATREWISQNEDNIGSIATIPAEESQIKSISSLKSYAPVLLTIKIEPCNISLSQMNKVVYLDDVQDPGNVGTILRIADWYGIEAVIRSPESADFYNPKVIQSSMGSFANVHLITLSKEELLHDRGDMPVIATLLDGQSIRTWTRPQKGIVVMGNEGAGISPVILDHADHLICIPGNDSRLADSLNVSVTAGIILQHIWGK